MSRYSRPRQIDSSRNFIVIKDNDEFKQIQQDENENGDRFQNINIINDQKTKKIKKEHQEPKEQEIIIPQMSVITLTERKELQLQECIEYIKLNKNQNLPLNSTYEADDGDLKFIDSFNKKQDQNSKISIKIFEKLIVTCESASIKEQPVMLYDIKNRLQEQISFLSINKIEEIYDYWRDKRKQLKRPLLRILQKPTIDESNPNIAFRPRDKDKMKLRRPYRINEVENLQRLKHFKKEMEVTKLLIEQIIIRDSLKLNRFELALHQFELQKLQDNFTLKQQENHNLIINQIALTQQSPPSFYSSLDEINIQLVKNINEIKKLTNKQNKYISYTKQDNYQQIQNQNFKNKKQNEQLYIDKLNNNDNLNFNVAAFLSSVIIDSNNNNITKDIIDNPRLLNKIKKNKNETLVTNNNNNLNQINNGSNILNNCNNIALSNANGNNNINNIENQVISNRYYPSTSQQQKNINVKDNQKQKDNKKNNIIKFNIRRRLDRFNRLYIDRYFSNDINDVHFNQKLYIRCNSIKNLSINTLLNYPNQQLNNSANYLNSNINNHFNSQDVKNFNNTNKNNNNTNGSNDNLNNNRQVSNSNNFNVNLLQKEKLIYFQNQWNLSDNDEEDFNESVKNIKKNLSGFKQFMKQKKQSQQSKQQNQQFIPSLQQNQQQSSFA